MDFELEAGIFLTYTAILLFIYFFGRIMLIPLKVIIRLIICSFIGGIAIIALNVVGSAGGFGVPLNLLTAFIAGVGGIPGVASLVVFFNTLY